MNFSPPQSKRTTTSDKGSSVPPGSPAYPAAALLNLPIASLASFLPASSSLLPGSDTPREAPPVTTAPAKGLPAYSGANIRLLEEAQREYLHLITSLINREGGTLKSGATSSATSLWASSAATNPSQTSPAGALQNDSIFPPGTFLPAVPLLSSQSIPHGLLLAPSNGPPSIPSPSGNLGNLESKDNPSVKTTNPGDKPLDSRLKENLSKKDDIPSSVSPDDDRIDVCNFKEPFLLKKAPHTGQLLRTDEHRNTTDDESEHEADTPLPTFSHLDSECARTVPSLMKFYSRHKRSLSSSLTVSLSVSGQATPPSSPISPGTLPRPSPLSTRDKVPTPKGEENKAHESSDLRQSPLAVPTLLTIPKVSLPLPITTSGNIAPSSIKTPKKTQSPCVSSNVLNSHFQTMTHHRQPLLKTCSNHNNSKQTNDSNTIISSNNHATTTSVPVTSSNAPMPGSVAINPFATVSPWGLSHTPCAPGLPPTPFWLPPGMDAGVGARIGLGLQLATDPLTGHIILVPRPHPLQDPNSHGLMWAGFGGMAAPHVVMTPQQLLLEETHYRPMHPPPSLLHMSHASIHPPAKTNPSSPKEDCKKVSPATASPSTDFAIPPHFIYPPTSLPYFYPQPPRPAHYPIGTFNPCPTTTLNLTTRVITSSVSSLNTTSATVSTTTNKSSTELVTTFSGMEKPRVSSASDWSEAPPTTSKSSLNFYHVPFFNSKRSCEYSEPPIDLTQRTKVSTSSLKQADHFPKKKTENLFSKPLSVTMPPPDLSVNKQGLMIKKEIKQEVLSPNSYQINNSIANNTSTTVKEEISLRKHNQSHYSCDVRFEDKAEQTPDIIETDFDQTKDKALVIKSFTEDTSTELFQAPTLKANVEKPSDSPPDISGLKLLSDSILEHTDHLKEGEEDRDNSDVETSSYQSDTMPHLEPANYSPSPRSSPLSHDSPPPVLSPLMPILLNQDSQVNPPTSQTESVPSSCKGLHGLSLLCALALSEQRFQDEGKEHDKCSTLSSLAEVASTQLEPSEDPKKNHISSPPTNLESPLFSQELSCSSPNVSQHSDDVADDLQFVDINRNYKSPHSEQETNKSSPSESESEIGHKGIGVCDNDLRDIQPKYKDRDSVCSPNEMKKVKRRLSMLDSPSVDMSSIDSNTENRSGERLSELEDDFSDDLPEYKLNIDHFDKKISAKEFLTFRGFKQPEKFDIKHEESDEDEKDPPNDPTESSAMESSPSDIEQALILPSSSKKRKPGRPKKHSRTKDDPTETIVAKKSKTINFLMLSQKNKVRPKLKAELKIKEHNEEEDGTEVSTVNLYCNKENADDNHRSNMSQGNVNSSSRRKSPKRRGRPSFSKRFLLRDKEKRKSAIEKQVQFQDLFRNLKRHNTMAATGHDESDDDKEEPLMKREDITEETPPTVSEQQEDVKPAFLSQELLNESSHALESSTTINSFSREESGEVPIVEEPSGELRVPKQSNQDKESSVCKLQIDDLISRARVLILQDGLLYAGTLTPITPPDVYGIHIDGERSTKLHIFCQEDLLTQAWKEVKPGSTRFLTEGTRICAFWSQQYRGLYPGTVAPASSPSQEGNHNFVNVEFDDGDSGRIHVDDVRLLPQDFPVIEYDPNPLMTLNKRKRRPTEERATDAKDFSEPVTKKPNIAESGTTAFHEDGQEAVVEKLLPENERDNSPPPSPSSHTEKKKHKKRRHSDHHRHKHKHKHRHKHKHEDERPLPHVEPGDGELRMRIKSPPLTDDKVISGGWKSGSAAADSIVKIEPDTQSLNKEEPYPGTSTRESTNNERQSKKKDKRAKRKNRRASEKSKIAPFLLERRLWKWAGKAFKRPAGKGKFKYFYKQIVRGKEEIKVGDCAVFLSTGEPDRPYIGKIVSLWQQYQGNMLVRVEWFYHPQETKGLGKRLSEPKGALFHSPHTDVNDVQTISHKCNVVHLSDYKIRRAELERKKGPDYENYDLFYLAGFYNTSCGKITMEPGVS